MAAAIATRAVPLSARRQRLARREHGTEAVAWVLEISDRTALTLWLA
jgi:hypothetical protein